MKVWHIYPRQPVRMVIIRRSMIGTERIENSGIINGVELRSRSPGEISTTCGTSHRKKRLESVAYENRTKCAKSGGLEKSGPGERISGLSRCREVRSFTPESPWFLAF
jgi:hypothetical protein